MDFFEQNAAALAAFAHMSQSIGARADYVQGGGGNTSVKLAGGLMAIKASGYCLKDITPSGAYAVLDYAQLRDFYYHDQPEALEDVEKAGAAKVKSLVCTIEGLSALRPSVEAGFHSLLDTYVAHTHSVYANLACCTRDCRAIAAEALADADYTWGFVPYTDPGARLTFTIRDELKRCEAASGKTPEVIFMENHGVIVHGADPARVERIHDDLNARIARVFGIDAHAFPQVTLKQRADGLFENTTPYLRDAFKGCAYTDRDMVEDSLYPDQLVFLNDAFHMGPNAPAPAIDHCTADTTSGLVLFNMPGSKAQVMAETLSAVLFIRAHIQERGYALSTMGEAAKAFIANWESEKYRKALSAK